MKRQLKCIHNKAINPELGVICDLRKKNSLCSCCKTFKSKYPSYCCQKCGKYIGWLGGLIKHECKF